MFKKSKYINTSPREYQSPNLFVNLSISPVPAISNGLSASCEFICCPSSNGRITLLPLGTPGDYSSAPKLSAHGQKTHDLAFSPFHENVLASCGEDSAVKIWSVVSADSWEQTQPQLSFRQKNPAIIQWHSVAKSTIAVAGDDTISLYDVNTDTNKCIQSTTAGGQRLNGGDIQSLSWSHDGRLLACTDTNLGVCIYDFRADPASQSVLSFIPGTSSVNGGVHTKDKPARVMWTGSLVGNSGVACLYQHKHLGPHLGLYDIRNISNSLTTQCLDSGVTNTPRSFYDGDTDTLYLSGKNSVSVSVVQNKAPYYTPCTSLGVSSAVGEGVGGGICMIPKRAVDIMSCEINRLFRCTPDHGGSVVPVSFLVPRKDKNEYHDDLYPMTRSVAMVSAGEWLAGDDRLPELVSMKPVPKAAETDSTSTIKSTITPASKTTNMPASTCAPTPVKRVDIVRSTKLRYVLGKALHKNHNIDGVRGVSTSVPTDSHLLIANGMYVAYPTSGSGGGIAVVKRSNPESSAIPKHSQRLTTKPLSVMNGAPVLDFVFCPTDARVMAVACEDGVVRVWTIPEDLSIDSRELLPENVQTTGRGGAVTILKGHNKKVHLVRFSPISRDIISTASYDDEIRIWNASNGECMRTIYLGSDNRAMSIGWSCDGGHMAVQCRDGALRILDVIKGTIVKKTMGHASIRGGRVCYIGNTGLIITTGFSKTSTRQMRVLNAETLVTLSELSFDESPGILDVHCDVGTGLVFLYAKGDTQIQMVEVNSNGKSFALDACRLSEPTDGISFLQKYLCDVRNIEVARSLRLTSKHIEIISFTVPRTRTDVFHDDLFPDLIRDWEPTCSAEEFFSKARRPTLPPFISLCPKNMVKASEVLIDSPVKSHALETLPRAQQEVIPKDKDMMNRMNDLALAAMDTKLEQDDMEGVDADEWDD
eukprot:CFRG6939T1